MYKIIYEPLSFSVVVTTMWVTAVEVPSYIVGEYPDRPGKMNRLYRGSFVLCERIALTW